MIYLELFWSFFQIGLFSIGGGYAAMPLIQNQVVDLRGWLSLVEFADIVTISQMTPGPIAINAATFVGTRVGGLPGAVIATVGCITPSIIIVLILARIYLRYRNLAVMQGVLSLLRPAVVALISAAGLSLIFLAFFGGNTLPQTLGGVNWISVALFAVCLFVMRKCKLGPIMALVGTGVVGIVVYRFIL
jgi:chromate transporter